MIDPTAFIDPTAIVEDGVTIGARSKVWPRFLARDGQKAGAVGGCEIRRQAHGQNMPKFAIFHRA